VAAGAEQPGSVWAGLWHGPLGRRAGRRYRWPCLVSPAGRWPGPRLVDRGPSYPTPSSRRAGSALPDSFAQVEANRDQHQPTAAHLPGGKRTRFLHRIASGTAYISSDGKQYGFNTPIGEHYVVCKRPTRHMRGGDPHSQSNHYDLPGIPWVTYFTSTGAAIHGTYWHITTANRPATAASTCRVTQPNGFIAGPTR